MWYWTRSSLKRLSVSIVKSSSRKIKKSQSKHNVQKLCVQKSVQQESVNKSELSKFIEITESDDSVMIWRSDLKINVIYIIKLTDHSRVIKMNLRDRLDIKTYDLIQKRENQNTYVDFNIEIKLCQEYRQLKLKKQLHSLKYTSKKSVLQAELSHVEAQS